jgi:hypothetical protein
VARTWRVIRCTHAVCLVPIHLYGFESRCTALQFDLPPSVQKDLEELVKNVKSSVGAGGAQYDDLDRISASVIR